MGFKISYTLAVSVNDSLDQTVKNAQVLTALAGLSCLEGTVLDHLTTEFADQKDFQGGYLRLTWEGDGRPLQLSIEIESPRELTKAELKKLRENLDGQVADGIGAGAFDFVTDATGLSIEMWALDSRKKSTLVQSQGTAWRPQSKAAEAKRNRQRCKEIKSVVETAEAEQVNQAKKKSKGAAKPDPKGLFNLLQKSDGYPRPKNIAKQIAAEIANLGGALSFIASHKMPFVNFRSADVLPLLLDAGLNPNLLDKEGHSLLWLSIWDVKCLSLLLDRGADINLQNDDVFRETALIRAAGAGEAKGVRLLLERGADPRLKTFFGQAALDEAKQNISRSPENAVVVKLLEDAAASH
jgi:hypothetical protein